VLAALGREAEAHAAREKAAALVAKPAAEKADSGGPAGH
jgi:hypothetical protein